MHLVWTLARKAKLGSVLHSAGMRWRSWRRPAGQAGQTLAEYALILSLVAAVVIVFAMMTFRDNIATAFDSASTCIQTACSQSSEEGGDNNDHCNDGNGQDGNHGNCDD